MGSSKKKQTNAQTVDKLKEILPNAALGMPDSFILNSQERFDLFIAMLENRSLQEVLIETNAPERIAQKLYENDVHLNDKTLNVLKQAILGQGFVSEQFVAFFVKRISQEFFSISDTNNTRSQNPVEHLTSIPPAKYVMPNNKLANVMGKEIIDGIERILNVSRNGAKKRIETSCILTYEGDNVELVGRNHLPFSEYDRNVYDAITSIYVFGDESHNFTPSMVFRAMTGMQESEKITDEQEAAVVNSIEKMRFVRVRVNCTAELQARNITLNSQQINNGEIDTYLLPAKACTLEAGGQQVKGYHLMDVPILYEYASAVNQVLSVPTHILDIKEINDNCSIGARLPNTESRIVIKGYLLRRIEGMKGKNNLNSRIIALFDYQKDNETTKGLYSIAGKSDASRTEMQRIRKDVEKMLIFWKTIDYIKDYKPQIKQKKITGYEIFV